MKREPKGDTELLAAYVDGVAEISLDERKRVDDLLARDPELRRDETATRALIGQLRELPPVGGAPDWAALERSISRTVDEAAPLAWWQRWRWRWILPATAMVAAAAILAIVLHEPAVSREGDEVPTTARPETIRRPVDDTLDPRESLPLWLDGTDLDVAFEADDLFDLELEWELDDDALPETAELLPPSVSEWQTVEAMDGPALERVERFLDDQPRRGRS